MTMLRSPGATPSESHVSVRTSPCNGEELPLQRMESSSRYVFGLDANLLGGSLSPSSSKLTRSRFSRSPLLLFEIHCVDSVEFNSMTLSVELSGDHPSSLELGG